MSKYKIGDRFIVEITDLDDGGMGTAYTLNGSMFATDAHLDVFELLPPLSQETDKPIERPKTYTSKDIFRRIKSASALLNDLLQVYAEMTDCIDNIDVIDKKIEELSL